MILQADSSFLGAYLAAAESGDVIIGYELYQELCNLREDIISERYIYKRIIITIIRKKQNSEFRS